MFDCSTYLEAKALAINYYLKQISVDHVVVRADKNVVSRVMLAILVHAAKMNQTPVSIILAIEDSTAGDLEQATAKLDLYGSWRIPNENENLLHNSTVGTVVKTEFISKGNSATTTTEQTSATVYDQALKLFAQGCPAIICGMTDFRNDGAVNYWGNNGRGLFDMQILSDLHYTEVVELARHLQIPIQSSRVPSPASAEDSETTQFQRRLYQEQIDELHLQYEDNFPRAGDAVHLCVLSTVIPGGWTSLRAPKLPNDQAISKMQAQRMTLSTLGPPPRNGAVTVHRIDEVASIWQLHDFLSSSECVKTVETIGRCFWRGSDGHGKPVLSSKAGAGSLRTSIYDTDFAANLWQRLRSIIPPVEVFHETHALTDTQSSRVWYPVGVSPLIRFMKYDGGKRLVPHYDGPYVESESASTLYSLVIYLNTNSSGGTRFYSDRQRRLPFAQRDFRDQEICVERVLKEFLPIAGQAILFPHRLLHDSAPLQDESKYIIRTDVIFRNCCSSQQVASTAAAGLRTTDGQLRILDPHYLSACERYTPSELIEAGYLNVRRQEPVETNWLSTPFEKAVRGLKAISPEQTKDPLVVFSTGCYNPPHQGHIHILEVAKRALESRGYPVIGGYLVPAHQSYVDQKTSNCQGQHASLKAPDRLSACGTAILNTTNACPWLDVDPYELLYGRAEVNFTATQHRLELYLRRHVSDRVQLVYVFGGDNASFARVYWKRGLAVCVNRPGYEKTFKRFRAEMVSNEEDCINMDCENRILWEEDREQSIDIASSLIRRHTPKNRNNAADLSLKSCAPAQEERTFRLRVESELNRTFALALATLIESFIPSCTVHLTTIPSQVASLSKAIASLRTIEKRGDLQQKGHRAIETISQEAHIPGTYTLALSRLYSLSNMAQATTYASPALISRPGSPDLQTQLAQIPSGAGSPHYLLFDDDIYTGATMRHAVAVLTLTSSSSPTENPARTICSTLSLTPSTPRP